MPTLPPETPRIFLDSSVLVAGAASFTGASRAILILAELGLLKLVVCPYILKETERNLAKKLSEALPYYRRLCNSLDWEVVSDPAPAEVRRWAGIIETKDAPVLAAAVEAKPARLVTLNTKDFTSEVARQTRLEICTPGNLVREIRALLEKKLGASPPKD